MYNTFKSSFKTHIIALSFWISMFMFMLYHIFKYIDPKLLLIIHFLSAYGMKYYYSKNMGIISSFIPNKNTIISWLINYALYLLKPKENTSEKVK